MNIMIRSCKCIEDYSELTCRMLAPKVPSKPFLQVIFKKGNEYVWKIKDGDYYVADTYKHLRHMDYYNYYVEYMDKEKFEKHFTISETKKN